MADKTPGELRSPTLQVTEIGEFVRFSSCLRRAKLAFNRRALARDLPFYSRLENALDVVLQEHGQNVESAWERQLSGEGYQEVAHGSREHPVSFSDVLEIFADAEAGSRIFAREVSVSGRISNFDVEGRIDFIVLMWRSGQPVCRIVEGKASRRDKTYHRLQVAAYTLLAWQQLEHNSVTIAGVPVYPDSIEGIVARIDEDLREPQDILNSQPLDLTHYIDDLQQLLADRGPISFAASHELDDLPFRLEPKCDGCVFNVHCLPEASRRRVPHLLGLSQSTCGALAQAGLHTIDQLAELDVDGVVADQLRSHDGIDEDPIRLKERAVSRRKMLPGGREAEGFAVAGLPMAGQSQCPRHDTDGQQLVRVFLNVDYDYVEDRIASAAAYIVCSSNHISTPFAQQEAGFRPSSGAFETVPGERELLPLTGRRVSQFKSTAWTGNPTEDSAAERQLLESFFQQLIEAIADVALTDAAPIHFYVWSASEMTRFMEGCARGGLSLIRHLSELLGCRQGREQLIFTALQSEVDRRYALGWTGRGLGVATSLHWFGRRFHWVRNVRGTAIELDRIFHQDVFDFASTLQVSHDEWAEDNDPTAELARFEIRSRFNDSLPMPYYAVAWGTLNSEDERWEDTPLARAAIRRYEAIRQHPGLMRTYLESRCEALRFIEERCSKNSSIEKPSFDLRDIGRFALGVDTPRSAAIDVLRIDWQVKYNDWRAAQTLTSGERVSSGRCLPLQNVEIDGSELRAEIAADSVGLGLETLQRRYADGEGSFVRLMPWSGDPAEPAEMSGAVTCVVDRINWRAGTVRLSPQRPMPGGHYRLFNAPVRAHRFAILEQSATDFVAPRVERRLNTRNGEHVDAWFNISAPVVSAAPQVDATRIGSIEAALDEWQIPDRPGKRLLEEQSRAAVRGISSRIQALQGPPGTGKTATTAAAIFARAAASLSGGDTIVLAGPTHRAVDTMVERLATWEASLRETFGAHGVEPHRIDLVRLDPRPDTSLPDNVSLTAIPSRVRDAKALLEGTDSIKVVCGTVSAMLKFEEKLGARASLDAALLVVDEASMMVFPHLLALASLTNGDGRIMLAGDNRQLSPILSHAWDREDRPPTVQFQPFLSAYEVAARVRLAVSALPNSDELVAVDRLRHTFRLPPAHRSLVATIYRTRDDLELQGRADHPGPEPADTEHEFSAVWNEPHGLVLVLHGERQSRKENGLERELVRQIIEACPNAADASIAILSPHRAQRSMLQEELADCAAVSAIDTVEKLQGGEAPTVIVSATASDPSQIQTAEDFLLNLNRANVAFSRAENRLVIVASESLVDHIASELETYEASVLWKQLRRVCSVNLRDAEVSGVPVKILGAASD